MSFKNCIKNSQVFKKLFYYKSITSTNDQALSLAGSYKKNLIVLADRQTEGRGRFNRIWFSPAKENLYFTLLIFHPQLKFNELSILTSFVLLKTLQVYKRSLEIKWPNDIVYENRKLCGTLIENEMIAGQVHYTAIGVGINLFTDFSGIGELKDMAVSLKYLTEKKILREKVFCEFVSRFEKNFLNFKAYRKQIIREWKRNMAYLNKRIELRTKDQTIAGILKKVSDDGSIVLFDGIRKHTFSYGEIA